MRAGRWRLRTSSLRARERATLPEHLSRQFSVLAIRRSFQDVSAGLTEPAEGPGALGSNLPLVAKTVGEIGRGLFTPAAPDRPRRRRPDLGHFVVERAQHVVIGAVVHSNVGDGANRRASHAAAGVAAPFNQPRERA